MERGVVAAAGRPAPAAGAFSRSYIIEVFVFDEVIGIRFTVTGARCKLYHVLWSSHRVDVVYPAQAHLAGDRKNRIAKIMELNLIGIRGRAAQEVAARAVWLRGSGGVARSHSRRRVGPGPGASPHRLATLPAASRPPVLPESVGRPSERVSEWAPVGPSRPYVGPSRLLQTAESGQQRKSPTHPASRRSVGRAFLPSIHPSAAHAPPPGEGYYRSTRPCGP